MKRYHLKKDQTTPKSKYPIKYKKNEARFLNNSPNSINAILSVFVKMNVKIIIETKAAHPLPGPESESKSNVTKEVVISIPINKVIIDQKDNAKIDSIIKF